MIRSNHFLVNLQRPHTICYLMESENESFLLLRVISKSQRLLSDFPQFFLLYHRRSFIDKIFADVIIFRITNDDGEMEKSNTKLASKKKVS